MQADPSHAGAAGESGGNGALTIFSSCRETSGSNAQAAQPFDEAGLSAADAKSIEPGAGTVPSLRG